MALRIIGAGLPRTGTTSLKRAIESLLDGRCYHMEELFDRLDTDFGLWQQALAGDLTVFDALFEEFVAAIDWPAGVFWRELADANPDALVVLTRRRDTETWWKSASRTVWESMQKRTGMEAWDEMADAMRARFYEDAFDVEGIKAAYERWNADVIASVDPGRLLVLEPSDGWEPLCAALNLPVPDKPYPHANTTAEFRAQGHMDD